MAASDVTDSLTLANALRGGGSPSFFTPGMKLAGQMAVPWAAASLGASALGLKGPLSMGGYDRGTAASFGGSYFGDDASSYSKPAGQFGSGQGFVDETGVLNDQLYNMTNEKLLAAGLTPEQIRELPFGYSGRNFSDMGTRSDSPFKLGFTTNYYNQPVGGLNSFKGDYELGTGQGQYATHDDLFNQFSDDYVAQALLAPENRMKSLDRHYASAQPKPYRDATPKSGGMLGGGNTSTSFYAPTYQGQPSMRNLSGAAHALTTPGTSYNTGKSATDMWNQRQGIPSPNAPNAPNIPTGQPVAPNVPTAPPPSIPTGQNTPVPVPQTPQPVAQQPTQHAGPPMNHQAPMARNYWMGQKITQPQDWSWKSPTGNQLATGLRA